MVVYYDYTIDLDDHVYPPSEDTFLLCDTIKQELTGRRFATGVDLGCGTGLTSLVLSEFTYHVFAVDVNPYAVELCKHNVKLNELDDRITVLKSDLFERLPDRYDVIVFNPPYLPRSEGSVGSVGSEVEDGNDLSGSKGSGSDWFDLSLYGGVDLLIRFVDEVSNHLKEDGILLLLMSSLTPPYPILKYSDSKGISFESVSEKQFFFETLYVYRGRFVE